MFYDWKPYVPVAERRANAARELAKLAKKSGRKPDPVVIEGRAIAATVWGKAWCAHLEQLRDFASRLPRGRTYARNGSVVDLAIAPGRIEAYVAGSELYRVGIDIQRLDERRWREIVGACAAQVGSLVDLLAGRISPRVLATLAHPTGGLFPLPSEIAMTCSCPDWATMCKHVAAVLYGVGARLDARPELLFTLRRVDQRDLVGAAAVGGALTGRGDARRRIAADADLGAIFGIEVDDAPSPAPSSAATKAVSPPRPRRARSPKRGAITAAELLARGIPRSTFQNWVTAGVLERTDRRGAYRTTPAAEARIAAFATERKPAKAALARRARR